MQNLSREALRLQALADDREDRFLALVARAEAAADLGHPGPTAAEIEKARRLAVAARAAADAMLKPVRPRRRVG